MSLRRILLVLALSAGLAATVTAAGLVDRTAGQAVPGGPDPWSVSSHALAAAESDAHAAAERAGRDLREAGIRYAAPLLEDWILRARAMAFTAGVSPISPEMADRLRGFFPDEELGQVRWRIGWPDSAGVERELFRLLDARAITLVDVIVFRDQEVADDPGIWAHELTHVRQYRRLGMPGFARHYVADRNTLEMEAWDATASYTMWAIERGLR